MLWHHRNTTYPALQSSQELSCLSNWSLTLNLKTHNAKMTKLEMYRLFCCALYHGAFHIWYPLQRVLNWSNHFSSILSFVVLLITLFSNIKHTLHMYIPNQCTKSIGFEEPGYYVHINNSCLWHFMIIFTPMHRLWADFRRNLEIHTHT